MDPMGFSLEHFDATGHWREKDGQLDIDSSGEFPDGQSFDGWEGMSQLVSEDPKLKSCVAEQMYIYALGKGLSESDEVHLHTIIENYSSSGAGFQDLIEEIVTNPAFTMRRGEPAEDASVAEDAQ